MDLSILIVTYNSAHLMGSLLSHLKQEIQTMEAEVIIVDNGSRDGTADRVRSEHPWVNLIDNQVNLGFAAGNNLAATHATGKYLLLLNPDAIPDPGSLSRALTLLNAETSIGLAGGQLIDRDGKSQPSARMFPTLRDEFFALSGLASKFPSSRLFGRLDRRWADPTVAAEVDWIPGAFVFIPASVFKNLGGFDERFFMYYEEVDLCRRMQASGLKIHYWPSLRAMHIGGESAKTVKNARVSRAGSQLESWRMRSGLLYYRKQHGLLQTWGLHFIEWSWHKLRQWKAMASGNTEKAKDFSVHCDQLKQAWTDTDAGRVCPARPW